MDSDQKLLVRDLNVKTRKGYLCARVMRKWNYDGNIPGGPVLYVGLLLADEQAASIYAQIPGSEAERLGSQLEIDKVYTLRKFTVRVSKGAYVPYDGDLMIQITSFTTITPSKTPATLFPQLIYRITPFTQIRATAQSATKYIDVIGIVTSEEAPKTMCPKGKDYTCTLKEVTIKDLSGNHLTVTLWENHAHQFQLQDPSAVEPMHSVVALFCGVLPKRIFNKTQVNAGSASRWFLNPNIPEAQSFYDSLKTQPVEICRPAATTPSKELQKQPAMLEHKTLSDMNAINPYDFPEIGCKCTVTIQEFPSPQEWWYMGCDQCKRRLRNNGGSYYCNICKCSTAIPLYKLTFVAADETASGTFFAYDVNARQILRRNCDAMLRMMHNQSDLPEHMLRAVGRTYTFTVSLTDQSYTSMDTRTYLVQATTFRPQQQNSDASPSLLAQPPPRAAFENPHNSSTSAPATLTTSAENDASKTSGSQDIIAIDTQNTDTTSEIKTPPPDSRTEETPVKQLPQISGMPSDGTQASHETVRKRLFPATAGETKTNSSGKIDADDGTNMGGKKLKHASPIEVPKASGQASTAGKVQPSSGSEPTKEGKKD